MDFQPKAIGMVFHSDHFPIWSKNHSISAYSKSEIQISMIVMQISKSEIQISKSEIQISMTLHLRILPWDVHIIKGCHITSGGLEISGPISLRDGPIMVL